MSATAAERAEAAAWQAALVSAGCARAKVVAVATSPGQGADVKISGVPMAEAEVLGRVIRTTEQLRMVKMPNRRAAKTPEKRAAKKAPRRKTKKR